MSLYESPSFNYSEQSFVKALPAAVPPTAEPANRLAEALDGLFIVRKTETVLRGTETLLIFTGTLTDSAAALYEPIAERFRALGYTAMLERYKDEDVVVAVPGLARVRSANTAWWLHLGLLLITIVSTAASGAQFGGYPIPRIWNAVQIRNWAYVGQAALTGAPFAFTLLLILGVHEMGHYIAARRHNVNVTLTFFIPLPVIGLLGTLGAVIFIKSSMSG